MTAPITTPTTKQTKEEILEKALDALERIVGAQGTLEKACDDIDDAIKALAQTGTDDITESVIAEWSEFVRLVRAGLKAAGL